ncbi:MAG TPA: dihydrolipoamide acetyltransferase family protein [Solirubrobacterales bacterium]|nr:dihydrolipoamide acetyltransferase family protein [Solirubrobacterales bacterium]
MPKLSDSMEEGTILSWLIAAGAEVAVDDDLLEVETDKANMTVRAEAAGVLEILVAEGETVVVGAPIARIGEGAAAPPPAEAAEPTAPSPSPDQPAAAPAAPVPPTSPNGGEAPRATPLARRIAAVHGVDLGSLRGAGAGGRITKADVRAAAGIELPPTALPPAAAAPSPRAAAAIPPAADGAVTEGAKGASAVVEPSRLQATIARRMSEAKATVPHFQVETEVRMDAAIALRQEMKALAGDGPAPSFNDMVVKAAALALRRHPKANGSYVDAVFKLHDRVNVGIAVAGEEALVVPTLFDADGKSLGEISRESRRLAGRVRSGEITPPELAGGTFTVSNLGMFGMTAIYPVINLPQAAILGVGMTRQLLVRGADGEIEDAALMTLTLSCDHRILYGAEAARFLGDIRKGLESPLAVML